MTMRTDLARIVPSARTPVFTVTAALRRRQVSIDSEIDRHTRTGRFAFQASAATKGSIFTDALPPKPPPTKGEMMRTFARGTSNTREITFWMAVGDWPQLHNVNAPSAYAATTQCGSMA